MLGLISLLFQHMNNACILRTLFILYFASIGGQIKTLLKILLTILTLFINCQILLDLEKNSNKLKSIIILEKLWNFVQLENRFSYWIHTYSINLFVSLLLVNVSQTICSRFCNYGYNLINDINLFHKFAVLSAKE